MTTLGRAFLELCDGTKGFDANTPISPAVAKVFLQHGYRFVVRYIRRGAPSSHDLSRTEAENILLSGLGLMLVQHVAPEGWTPTPALGTQYGQIAAAEALALGYRPTGIVWCDLEGIKPHTPAADVIAFCNNWHQEVKAVGFEPGLYVGYGAGLTADQLYKNLRFSRYWSAYNLNKDSFPAVRGVQMKQSAYPGPLVGEHFEFDVDTVQADALGDRVKVLV